ncbi:hypothetical protein [Parabacteroides goldsteinii]|uniref:hypothetical protein n=1 Tax=Parabacteroides goldsteinii TaxID=328812 RepID=UPI00267191C3|nr:hypothetical protein [Parabacteroides goldsteinii]
MAKEKCDRDCSTCGNDNRSFCAVQMAMANQEILLAIAKEIRNMKGDSDGLLPPSPLAPVQEI